MAVKSSFIKSVVNCNCPRCREGELFVDKRHYHLSTLLAMHSKCAKCGQDFEIEPGFYLGAMWVSYPFVIGFEIIFLLIGLYVFQLDLMWGFVFSTSLLFAIGPLILRIGRSLFLHLNVRYKG